MVERFNREFVEERRRQEEEHPDLLDFTGFDFPDEVMFENELPMVYFKNATFRKAVSISTLDEVSFVFEGDAVFSGATFEGDAVFSGAIFKGDAGFDGVTFKGYAGFSGATFEGYVWFREVTFEERVVFDEATFVKYTVFRGITFKGGAKFFRINFKGGAGFTEVTFEKRVVFDFATFEGGAWFDGITFKGDVGFTELSISAHTSFNNTVIERRFILNILKWGYPPENISYTLDIRSPVFGEYGKMVITGSLGTTQDFNAGISLLDTEMEKIEFIEANWPRLYNRKTIIDEVFLTREIEDKIKPPHTLSPEIVAQTYRSIRKNYEDARRYSDAGDFLIGEMEVTRKYKQNTEGTNIKRSHMDSTWILHGLYYSFGKYGESIERPLIWLSSIWIIVSGFHFFYLNKPQDCSRFVWYLLESAYITLSAMFPFTSITTPFDFFMKLIGSLLIGLIFIALRRRLERK